MNSEWTEVEYHPGGGQKALRKDYSFKNFIDALAFVNKVGAVAEEMGHHPDIRFTWGLVNIWLTSHDAHGITERDYDLSKKIDKISE